MGTSPSRLQALDLQPTNDSCGVNICIANVLFDYPLERRIVFSLRRNGLAIPTGHSSYPYSYTFCRKSQVRLAIFEVSADVYAVAKKLGMPMGATPL